MKERSTLTCRCGSASLYPTWFRWKIMKLHELDSHSLLYIPHGSDERKSRYYTVSAKNALYPTWFRWKLGENKKEKFHIKLYIPHGSDESWKTQLRTGFCIFLYIPHGSDESRTDYLQGMEKTVFISHMVQMKDPVHLSSLLPHQWLYIPHGSDERPDKVVWLLFRLYFISHMVQMKAFFLSVPQK